MWHNGCQVLAPPSPQDSVPAHTHALQSTDHLARIRLLPYDYPIHATTTTQYRAQAEQESSICRSPVDATRTHMIVCDQMYARKTANETRQSTPISLEMSLVHRAHGSGSTCDQLVLSRNAISKLAKEKSTPSVEVLQDHHVLHRIGKAEPFSTS